MNTVTLSVSSMDQTRRQLSEAFRGEDQGSHISFASIELLWKVLTAKRWELLKAMAGHGPMSIREAARHAGRDVKAVHADVHALLAAGVLDHCDDGRIVFPYDAVHVNFVLRAA